MKEAFRLCNSQNIVIYGASKNGIYYANFFVEQGFQIAYFIDKNAANIGNYIQLGNKKVSVYTIENVPEKHKEDYIVYIAVRNPVEQTKCADLARKNRYQKIIYLPLCKKTKETAEGIDALIKVYNEIISGRIASDVECPKQSYFDRKVRFRDAAIIDRDKKVICYTPLDIIYYHSVEQIDKLSEVYGISRDRDVDLKYSNRPFAQMDFFRECFSFFLEGKGNIQSYMDVIMKMPNDLKCQSNVKNQEWLNDRKTVIENVVDGIFYERGFWKNAAIPITWNRNGFFNIQDGIHRYMTSYMLYMNKIPTQMSTDDYGIWLNKEKLSRCLKYLEQGRIHSFPTPISHPFFMDCKSECDSFGKTTLTTIQEYLTDIWERGMKVLDLNPQIGYFSQHFARMGGKVTAISTAEDKFYNLFCYLNELMYLEQKIQISTSVDRQEYDIVLCMKMRDQMQDEEQWKEYIEMIDKNTKNILVWESGFSPADERDMILKHTQFVQYDFLRYVLEDKKIREIGVFVK